MLYVWQHVGTWGVGGDGAAEKSAENYCDRTIARKAQKSYETFGRRIFIAEHK